MGFRSLFPQLLGLNIYPVPYEIRQKNSLTALADSVKLAYWRTQSELLSMSLTCNSNYSKTKCQTARSFILAAICRRGYIVHNLWADTLLRKHRISRRHRLKWKLQMTDTRSLVMVIRPVSSKCLYHFASQNQTGSFSKLSFDTVFRPWLPWRMLPMIKNLPYFLMDLSRFVVEMLRVVIYIYPGLPPPRDDSWRLALAW